MRTTSVHSALRPGECRPGLVEPGPRATVVVGARRSGPRQVGRVERRRRVRAGRVGVVPDVVEVSPGSMSVVTGGLVLVIVSVVVDVDDDGRRRAARGAGVQVVLRTPARGRWPDAHARHPPEEQGEHEQRGDAGAGERSTCVRARRARRPRRGLRRPSRPPIVAAAARSAAGSAELGDDLAREELHVVEIGHVEYLQVDPLHAGLGERAELVDDLGRACRPAASCRAARRPRGRWPRPAGRPRRRRGPAHTTNAAE